MERKCEYLDTDLSKTRIEKNSFEVTVKDMSSKLTFAEEHSSDLKSNIEELKSRLEELEMFNQVRIAS